MAKRRIFLRSSNWWNSSVAALLLAQNQVKEYVMIYQIKQMI